MKHKPDMIAAWAKENGIRGFDQYDPNQRNEDKKKNSQRKKFNKTVTTDNRNK
jgi:hypothetical protein